MSLTLHMRPPPSYRRKAPTAPYEPAEPYLHLAPR